MRETHLSDLGVAGRKLLPGIIVEESVSRERITVQYHMSALSKCYRQTRLRSENMGYNDRNL